MYAPGSTPPGAEVRRGTMRCSERNRETKETRISVTLSLDGGAVDIKTGIGFFDHMLTALAF